jgi:hypothetical protein
MLIILRLADTNSHIDVGHGERKQVQYSEQSDSFRNPDRSITVGLLILLSNKSDELLGSSHYL